MAETYSAGIVTAYGAAVRGGYTGTYDEFCTEQAGFSENAQQVAEDRAAVEQQVSDFGAVTVPAAEQQIAAAGAAQVAAVNAAGQDKETDIAAAGAAQVTRVEITGTQTVGSVETAGSQQVAAVNTAGSAQVAAVAAEGTTQTGAVQAKGQEVIASIPEDYTALVDEVAAVGKAITEVSKTADAVYTQRVYGTTDTGLFSISSGGLDWEHGTNKTDTKRARSANTGWDIDGTTRFILDNNNYNFAVMYYSGTPGSGTYISSSGWVDNGSIIAEKAGAKKVRLQFIRKDEASMTSADYDAISAALMRYDAIREIAVDDTLTIAGAAADAKSTGDKITTLTDSIDPLFVTAYDAMHVAVGRLGTLGGINNTIRWCAYTQVLWEIPEGATALKIVCPGYYFKLLEYETSRIGTSNVPVWYNTGYAYNTLTAPIADTAKFIGINVCKEEGSETALTADDISDIDAKLVVLENTAISQTGDDIALCTDSIGALQAHGKQNIASLPVCYFPASYESQEVMTYALGSGTEAGYNSTQGMCGDHKRYVWVSCKRRNSIDTEPVTIVKYDTVTGEVIQAVSEREYGHINDMCYVEDTNEIYILSWVTDDVDNYYPAGTYDRISVVDADTLQWKRDFGLKDILGAPGVNVDLPSLSAITYNTTFKLFAGVIKPHDVDGVSTKGIVTWTLDGNFDRWRSFPARFEPGYTNFTTSGMDCDNQCLYCLFGYRLYYFDWQTLKPIGKTPDSVLSDVEAALDATQEAESVSVFKDCAFINANNYQSHSDRTIPQVTLYKSNPKTVQFLGLQSLLDALQD